MDPENLALTSMNEGMKFVMETRLMNTIRKPRGEDVRKVSKQPSIAQEDTNPPDLAVRS